MREIEKYLKDISSFYRKMAQEEEKIANRYLNHRLSKVIILIMVL